jgi:uncharacterized protein DUF6745
MKSATAIRADWVRHLLSTAPADRPRAEAGVRALYAAAGFPEPRHLLWFDSPRAVSWVVALIAARYHQRWAQRFASGLSRDDREQLDRARSALGSALGIADADQAVAAVGAPRSAHLQFPPSVGHSLIAPFTSARFTLSDDVASWYTAYSDDDTLHRAEAHFAGGNKGALRSAIHCPTTDILIGQSFYAEQSFSRMADDEQLAGDSEPPAIMRAAAEVGQSAGLWWPFENAAILSERPTELHLNERHLLHRADGPAAVFRDGWTVYAWNGKAVPEKWIMQPDTVSPREYKGFDPTFRQHVASKAAPPAKATKRKAKAGSILHVALAADPAARLEQLRTAAGGSLPRYDRYMAGAHREVWRELVSLGDRVRADPDAADALAVAYETMHRVESNVRKLVQRLDGISYTFGMNDSRSPQFAAHVPPPPDIHRRIVDFEKEYGTLPLSLRAFYAVVGEVNLIGTHPSIDPKGGSVATDPLVVYALDEGALEFDDEDEDGETPRAITIAPDDLHKANVSGGDAYEMAIPDLRADGELLNERHGLFFVDYLRLCFRFGGFPGYDGAERAPIELEGLSKGLLEF